MVIKLNVWTSTLNPFHMSEMDHILPNIQLNKSKQLPTSEPPTKQCDRCITVTALLAIKDT